MMKNSTKLGAMIFALAFSVNGFVQSASAQATRTWVSGVGDDVNPCSRTAPCKTFAGAISKTAAGGEINCLDPGGFGTLTITKSITIDCTGTFGSTLNSGGINGFVINDSATAPGTIDVKLIGLSINGAGLTPGLNGIRILSARTLIVQNLVILNQKGGSGISIAPTTTPIRVYINNTTIADGGTATTGGIEARPTGTGSVQLSLRNVNLVNNLGSGLRIDTTASTGPGFLGSIDDSQLSGNATGISASAGAGPGTTAVLSVNRAQIYANFITGITTSGAATRLRVGNSLITINTTGVSPTAGSFINNLGGNFLVGNVTEGGFN